jgi:hypothetical protein
MKNIERQPSEGTTAAPTSAATGSPTSQAAVAAVTSGARCLDGTNSVMYGRTTAISAPRPMPWQKRAARRDGKSQDRAASTENPAKTRRHTASGNLRPRRSETTPAVAAPISMPRKRTELR